MAWPAVEVGGDTTSPWWCNGEQSRACARGEKLGIPFIGERACEMDCERYLDARGGKLRSGVRCVRRTGVAGGNGWRGPG
jgi:hypothetical protein